MNTDEARQILRDTLREYRERSYSDLCALVNQPTRATEAIGPSGAWYQIAVFAVWDDRKGGDVRLIGNIDDGGRRAFSPLTDTFIMAPDGSFVGEGQPEQPGGTIPP